MSKIAIIGMACRLPGADTPTHFWHNLEGGAEAITRLSDEQISQAGIDPLTLPGSGYVRSEALLKDLHLFDPAYFALSPSLASALSPAYRIFLECSAEALENAGYAPSKFEGSIGVFVGYNPGGHTFDAPAYAPTSTLPGGHSYLASRGSLSSYTAYRLDLTGPALDVQTGASASLVATHLACQSILLGECELALVGGIAVRSPHGVGYYYTEGGVLSPDGHCRPFDRQAGGTVPGSGCVALVLGRLDNSLDAATIYGVIVGSAVNNDGAYKIGYAAPSRDGQAEVIAAAQRAAQLGPADISYVEAHAAGTELGDAIEVAALKEVWKGARTAEARCALGSLKSNLGHLDAASGAAALLKTTLCLRHATLVPTLHYSVPHPNLLLSDSPFYIVQDRSSWPLTDGPRRAGVSSFGLGGTNAHLILEEAPEAGQESPRPPVRRQQLLLLSAASRGALEGSTLNLGRYLRSDSAGRLEDVAYTLQVGRRHYPHRRFIIARGASEAGRALAEGSSRFVFSHATGAPEERSIGFLFPRHVEGAELVAQELLLGFPEFQRQMHSCLAELPEEIAEAMEGLIGGDSRKLEWPDGTALVPRWEHLKSFLVEYCLARLWISWGVLPAFLLSSGVGEYVSACVAGVMSVKSALRIVLRRDQLERSPDTVILFIPLSEEDVSPYLGGEAFLAAVNNPHSCVVAGPHHEVENIEQRLAGKGVAVRRLPSSLWPGESIVGTESIPITTPELKMPTIPMISGATGNWLSSEDATDATYWLKRPWTTLRIGAGIRTALAEKNSLLLPLGGGGLIGAVVGVEDREVLNEVVLSALGFLEPGTGVEALLSMLGLLWFVGVDAEWDRLHDGYWCKRVPLPTYPFERIMCEKGTGEDARPYVFVSYIREDWQVVSELCQELSRNNIRVWLDRSEIVPGARWRRAIRRAIQDGHCFLACFSETYERRERSYMSEELTLAIDELRRRSGERSWFIPVLVSPCRIPDRDIGAGETLQDLQWVSLYDDREEGIRRIIAAIRGQRLKL